MPIPYESAKTLIDAIFESMRTCLDAKDYIAYSTLADTASKIACLSEKKPDRVTFTVNPISYDLNDITVALPKIDSMTYTQADFKEVASINYEEDENVTFYGEHDFLGE